MNTKALLTIALTAMLAMAQAPIDKYLAATLAVALPGLGASIAIAIAGSAAMSAMVERPQERIWYLIFLALAEAIAIYGLLVSILILSG
jgi:V/A-type H+-transporting ATPase subunit K